MTLSKKNRANRHTGIVCYLDDECRFKFDYGIAGTGFNMVDGSPDRSRIELSGPFILRIDLYSDTDRNTVKDILREWSRFNMGAFDLMNNNCRDFCQSCMEIAKKHPNHWTG